MKNNRIPEYRAEPVKSLVEQRGEAQAAMQAIIDKAKAEVRAITDEESNTLTALEKQIGDIDRTVAAEKRASELLAKADNSAENNELGEDNDAAEVRALENYIKSECGIAVSPEYRSGEQNITMSNNGAVIPTSIANKIITTVKEMCPILAGVTMFAVKGTLKVPVWGNANSTHNITVGFQSEFTEVTSDAGKFTSVDLTGYLAASLTLIGKSVINNSEINIMDFVVNEMSKQIALWLEGKLLASSSTTGDGTSTISGALSTTTTLNAGSTTAITADNLIDLQAKIPTPYQGNACWTMHPDTFAAIRKLKDANNQYLLQTAPNIVGSFPYMLLGKPVYVSDNMPTIASAAKAVLYGDYSGLAVNMRQNIEMQVLNEKYATQHAVGLVAWFEFDSKMIDNQKLATLVMSA